MKGVEKLQEEYFFLRKGGLSHIGASTGPISRKNYLKWRASLEGPKNTPYENGIFYIEMEFNENYPVEKPKVKMKTKIYHPNINDSGTICLDYLGNKWNDKNDIRGILFAIHQLLVEPNFKDPLVRLNETTYKQIAKEYTQKYATLEQNFA